MATVISNIETVTGSPVNCTITNYTSGSTIVTDKVEFQDGSDVGAKQYAAMMKSNNVTGIFGTGYGSVQVDPNSVSTSQESNPARKSPEHIKPVQVRQKFHQPWDQRAFLNLAAMKKASEHIVWAS